MLSQQAQAVRGWLESLVATAEELNGLDYQCKRERPQRLVVEVTRF